MDASQPARKLNTPIDRYPVPRERHRAELIVDRSRFLCTIERADSAEHAQALVREVNAEFPEATHHCWAYVIGAPGNTSHIGVSDDGEPHGTAGRPMLTVLLHSGVGEIVAVVTRWFGGTKLGTGGLVRAYGGAVQEALASLPTIMRIDAVPLRVVVDYSAITVVQQLFGTCEAVVSSEQFAEVVTFDVEVPREQEPALRAGLADCTRGQAVVTSLEDDASDAPRS